MLSSSFDDPFRDLLDKRGLISAPAGSSFPPFTASPPISFFCTGLIVLTCVFSPTFAQAPVGSSNGYVGNTAAAVILNATFKAFQIGAGSVHKTKMRGEGSLSIEDLEPVDYQVAARANGSLILANSDVPLNFLARYGPGIPDSKLRVLFFMQSTLWQRHKWEVIGLFALFAVQSLLIVFLLVERRNHQRARAALGKIEERNRAILRAIPDLMFFQSSDGTYLDCHARDPSQLLVSPDQFLGRRMDDVLPPQISSEFHSCFKRALETKETQVLEYPLSIAGEPRWFEARVAPCNGDALLSIVRDISESRRGEEALRESESRFAMAFKSNPQPMTLTTLEEGLFMDVNQSFLNMSGYERDEVIGRTSQELNIWEKPADRKEFLQQLRQNGSIPSWEMRFRTKSGEIRILLMSAELVDLAGEHCTLVTSADITERKQSEQWLSELTARLLRTQDEERRRIAEELHDVTAQGIGLILLNLALIKRTTPEMDLRSKDKLAESISLGEQALREIRTLSYVLHPPLLDQAGLVTALQWYAKGFTERSGIKVDFVEYGSDGHRMPPDVEYSLFRVVQECLTNVRRHTNSESATITLTKTKDDVELQVGDHGPGLRSKTTTNGDGIESLGVGIQGMRHRLKQLGGELAVVSTPNGTTVTATIPVRWVIYDSHSVS